MTDDFPVHILNDAAGCGLFHAYKCHCPRPWRILKTMYDPKYPWLIQRYTRDFRYEPVMRCATYDRATHLVQALVWLSTRDNPAYTLIKEGNPYVQ